MRHAYRLPFALLVGGAFALAGCESQQAATVPAQSSEQQLLVDKARVTVQELRTDRVVGEAVNNALRTARGVLIFPNLLRAGFVFGGSGGAGTLLARQPGGWSDPAFYFSGEGSFGLQLGAEAGKVVFVIQNDGALNKLVNGNVNLGVDLSVAAGPVGGGAGVGVTPNLNADLLAFSVQQGIFAGAAIKGGIITPLHDWNEAYYGPGATPRAIVIEQRFHNPGAQGLRAALASPP
jgi:lipid-binding SYLF domain-containing protein